MIPPRRQQALGWFERLRHDRSPETVAALNAWLAEDPRNRVEFEQQQALDVSVLQTGARGMMPRAAPAARPAGREPRRAWRYGIAAVLLLALVGTPWLLRRDDRVSAQAAVALTRPVRLPDGTIAILAMSAQAVPEFSAAMRSVLLSGSARFIVADDPRPMIIRSRRVVVTTRRGQVDIVQSVDGAVVLPVDAAVVVSDTAAPGQPVAPQQRWSEAGVAAAQPADKPIIDRIEADGLALSDLLRIVAGSDGPPIILTDEASGARRLTGSFQVKDHRVLARRLAAALSLRLDERADRLVLTRP